jgi:hypothetical protein
MLRNTIMSRIYGCRKKMVRTRQAGIKKILAPDVRAYCTVDGAKSRDYIARRAEPDADTLL